MMEITKSKMKKKAPNHWCRWPIFIQELKGDEDEDSKRYRIFEDILFLSVLGFVVCNCARSLK